MKIVIQVSPRDSAKAWALLVRHSPGVALPDGVFVISQEAVRAFEMRASASQNCRERPACRGRRR